MGFIGFVLKQKSAIYQKIQLIDSMQNGLICTEYSVGSLIFGLVLAQKNQGWPNLLKSGNFVLTSSRITNQAGSRKPAFR